ncbi:Spo0B domain-containing protein [Peptostreptococcaceae bacterium AGR-M142]
MDFKEFRIYKDLKKKLRHDIANDVQVIHGYLKLDKKDECLEKIENMIRRIKLEKKLEKIQIKNLYFLFEKIINKICILNLNFDFEVYSSLDLENNINLNFDFLALYDIFEVAFKLYKDNRFIFDLEISKEEINIIIKSDYDILDYLKKNINSIFKENKNLDVEIIEGRLFIDILVMDKGEIKCL